MDKKSKQLSEKTIQNLENLSKTFDGFSACAKEINDSLENLEKALKNWKFTKKHDLR